MSDACIRVIPRDPRLVPESVAQSAAVAYLRQYAPHADYVKASTSKTVRVRDCGENFVSVSCPSCQSAVDAATWGEWLGKDSDGEGFMLVPITMPCCGKQVTLNELTYDFDQGFSRFEIVVANANIGPLSEADVNELGRLLGGLVRIVYDQM